MLITGPTGQITISQSDLCLKRDRQSVQGAFVEVN